MPDLLDLLKKEIPSETKLLKVERKLEDYSESYNNVVFEQKALSEGNYKQLFLFHDSLNSLKKRGYERHARPNEAFSLFCSYLEGESSVKCIAENMLDNYGEWFSLAMKYQNNLLHCYIDPKLKYNKKQNKYTLKSYNSEMLFPMSELEEHTYIGIKELNAKNPDFVEFIWSRSFGKLPLEIRNNAYLCVPDETVWPAGRGSYGSRYIVSCNYNIRASRGVRVVGKNVKNHEL